MKEEHKTSLKYFDTLLVLWMDVETRWLTHAVGPEETSNRKPTLRVKPTHF